MARRTTRRKFLGVGVGALFGEAALLRALRPLRAAEIRAGEGEPVRFSPDIEPLVRRIEETSRERLVEEIAREIAAGLGYRELLTALLLAGVRNIQPRPYVGFKFHAVLVVHSAHLASLETSGSERWLPILWALDYFKGAEARDRAEGDWTLGRVKESAVPPPHRARAAFVEAMDAWDEEAADAAAAGVARHLGAQEAFALFARYGARDFRSIGHKAIYAAGAFRTLETIGWRHAEPVLRSLAYALLQHEGSNPAARDAPADRPWRRNRELIGSIPADWTSGGPDAAAARAVASALRTADAEGAAKAVVDALRRGAGARSVWDGLFQAASELVLRAPGIISLHALTATNAIHYAFVHAGDEELRKLLLLQNASFLPLFRDAAARRGTLASRTLEDLEPEDASARDPAEGAREIFETAAEDRLAAARKAAGYLARGGDPRVLMRAARLLVFQKADDPHDYKLSSAVLEDFFSVNPAQRSRFLAPSLLLLPHPKEADSDVVRRARAALGAG